MAVCSPTESWMTRRPHSLLPKGLAGISDLPCHLLMAFQPFFSRMWHGG